MEGIVFFIVRVIIAVLIAQLGKKRKIGFGWSLVLCVISPLIGLIIILCSKKKDVDFVDVGKDEYKTNNA